MGRALNKHRIPCYLGNYVVWSSGLEEQGSPHVKKIRHKINYVNCKVYVLNLIYDNVKMQIFHQEIKILMKSKSGSILAEK